MILRAKTTNGVLVFELEGQLDFETIQLFQDRCASIIQKAEETRIVFNMEKLRFVGSSGINQFIRAIKDFNALPIRPRLCQLSTEFQKIFKAYETARAPFHIYESEALALASFDSEPAPTTTKKNKQKTDSPKPPRPGHDN